MANTPSSRKRARQNPKRRLRNVMLRSSGRTAIKHVEHAIRSGDHGKAMQAFVHAQSVLDSLGSKGILKRNKIARHKSRLNARIVSLVQTG